jgi:hypothetical protein
MDFVVLLGSADIDSAEIHHPTVNNNANIAVA